ncbi:MAG: hypothetical protein RCO49_05060 [Rickettsia endosymbiont of Argas persicus]
MIKNSILGKISNTPTLVWVLFGYILFIGIKATRKNVVAPSS